MDTDPFASRLAVRVRFPVAAVGIASIVIALANLLHVIDDHSTGIAGLIVGGAAAVMFLTAIFDMRLQRAVSALNAERRNQAKQRGRLSRAMGWGLPLGDRLLVSIRLPLLVMTLLTGNYFHRLPATALLLAAFALTTVVEIALMAQGRPADRWFDPFT